MLESNLVVLENKSNDATPSCKIGLFEKLMKGEEKYPELLNFDLNLRKIIYQKKFEFILRDQENQPLFKWYKGDYYKLMDRNDNILFNFRFQYSFLLNHNKLFIWLPNDVFNKTIVKIKMDNINQLKMNKTDGITKLDSYLISFPNIENQNINWRLTIKNLKELKIYNNYKSDNNTEIGGISCKSDHYVLNVNSDVDIFLTFAISISILFFNQFMRSGI